MIIRKTIAAMATVIVAIAAPTLAQAPAKPMVTAESKLPASVVSIAVEPTLNDGRLVIRVAAQNRGTAAVDFGPTAVSLAKASGEKIAWMSLPRLANDVRLAAGMVEEPDTNVPTQTAYSTAPLTVRDGKVDVNGFTGSSTLARDEYVRRNQTRKTKPTISKGEAEHQIAALRQAILESTSIQPKQIVAGQLVSMPLKFTKGEDRTLYLRIHVGGDEHGFTIAAPEK